MLFLVAEDFLEQGTGGVVADFGGDLDGFVQVLDRVYLEREIAFKLRLDVVAAEAQRRISSIHTDASF
jgi:hypothetical protein